MAIYRKRRLNAKQEKNKKKKKKESNIDVSKEWNLAYFLLFQQIEPHFLLQLESEKVSSKVEIIMGNRERDGVKHIENKDAEKKVRFDDTLEEGVLNESTRSPLD
ncbi:hypothetical protein CEXT_199941 [Caerostris extrusa]|uniref:Ycf1 n=1 Tax=Caerostris extrusa TaxID=172846 RepID=A0AAV4PV55_CAEEX|nr:hypothetical protein CEXT_199941 [Caerostris extrusa]